MHKQVEKLAFWKIPIEVAHSVLWTIEAAAKPKTTFSIEPTIDQVFSIFFLSSWLKLLISRTC